MVEQLVQNLSRLDYPRRQLHGFLILEAHDQSTIAAATAAARPDWLQILIVPPGAPQTKPRALNHALTFIKGELVTVYDAEDAPDPGQLREAAAHFAQSPDLACVQAPLRVRRGAGLKGFLDRQFALEYAALFEVNLQGMAKLNLPFPLGGTSNLTLSGIGTLNSTLTVTNTATDPDVPAQTLTYELLTKPNGATIDANGIVRWTPTAASGSPSSSRCPSSDGCRSTSRSGRAAIRVVPSSWRSRRPWPRARFNRWRSARPSRCRSRPTRRPRRTRERFR